MFSSLFGSRGGGKTKGSKAAAKEAATAAAKAAAAEGEAGRPTGPRPETLEAVIATQKARCAQCQRHAEKAEHRRDNLLASAEIENEADEAENLNALAAEQEALRKSKTDMCIALHAQIGVLERVAAESGFRSQGLDEDLDVAAARQEKEEEEYYVERDAVEEMREKTEEVNTLFTHSVEEPVDTHATNVEIEAYQDGQMD